MRFLLPLVILLATAALPAQAGQRTASIGVSATVIASCRVEIASQVESQGAVLAAARLTCPTTSKPALRAVHERGVPGRPVMTKAQMLASNESQEAGGSEIRWIRYDVEY
ncbi:hypothetical protein DSM104443_01727 [Usitatibacter rugosus]|uniref:Uncharacterized protein n=1 Tax=Usitatibacter rugosus TaxID=2732067 RepID=A0A6M4GTL3_9PROT|nr:hypothetical protein [Usitatibacter rugosus]QJR10660.1 hypothetical protein DSM104443_01727 [Usitatibacter rugosus]